MALTKSLSNAAREQPKARKPTLDLIKDAVAAELVKRRDPEMLRELDVQGIDEVVQETSNFNKVLSIKHLKQVLPRSARVLVKRLAELKRSPSERNAGIALEMATVDELRILEYYVATVVTKFRASQHGKPTRRAGRKHRSSSSNDSSSPDSRSPERKANPSCITSAVNLNRPRKRTRSSKRNGPPPVEVPDGRYSLDLSEANAHSPMSEDTLLSDDPMDPPAQNAGEYNTLTVIANKYKEDPEQFMFMTTVPRRDFESHPMGGYLLPPKTPGDDRPTLILDLDETLLHSFLNIDDYDSFDWAFQVDTDDVVLDIYCKTRPFANYFLSEMAKTWEIVIFTASQESYASQVLDRLDPNGYISHRLYRNSCTTFQGNYLKDLSILGRPLDKTLIVDNSPLAFSFQPLNGVPCHTWTFEKDDEELFNLVPVLNALATVDDVRTEISQLYAMGRLIDWLVEYIEQQTQEAQNNEADALH